MTHVFWIQNLECKYPSLNKDQFVVPTTYWIILAHHKSTQHVGGTFGSRVNTLYTTQSIPYVLTLVWGITIYATLILDICITPTRPSLNLVPF